MGASRSSLQGLTRTRVCLKNSFSLRVLSVLCDSAVKFCRKRTHRRAAEYAEVAQSLYSDRSTTYQSLWISDIKAATMMPPRTLRIVALLLALIAGAVCALGYNFVFDKNIRPQVSTLDDCF